MAQNIKGITIDIDGNTTGLKNAIQDVDKQIRSVNSELTAVNKLLKVDPGNTELLAQKQKLLADAIEETTTKLQRLKDAKAQADASEDVDKNSKAYRELEREIASTEQNLNKLKGQQDENNKAMDGFTEATDDATKKAGVFGDVLKANLASELIKKGIADLANGMKKLASSFIDLGKSAIQSYADYEQLSGGIETLFKGSSDQVKKYASEAYATAQMNANDYMETVTSFSASLIQSLDGDTAKAGEYANRAIIDMADNANKMGTNIESIQSAYQGFAKQNYNMLDNLKLGYGGNKSEMERLIKDASKMTDVQKELGITVDASSMSFDNIVNAISVMQSHLGIAGTSAEEASRTISGSVNSMQSAWSNLITGLADDNANFEELVNNLVETLVGNGEEGTGVIANVLPRIETAFNSILELIPTLIERLLPTILELGTKLITTLIAGLTQAIPKLIPTVMQAINTITMTIIQNLPAILEAGIQIIVAVVQGIAEALPELIPALVDALIYMVEIIIDNLPLIIEAGVQLIVALALGLIEAIPKLLEKIPTIITKLVKALTQPEMLEKLISSAITLMIALAKGLVQAIPQIIGMVPKIIGELVKNFKETIKNTDWLQLGKNILKGILNGMLDFGTIVKDTIKKVGKKITSSIKSFFGISSPSKLMADQVGKFITQGIGVGIEDEIPDTIRDVNNAMGTLTDKVQASVNPVINPTANSNPLIIQIENFNNEREQDIQALAEELEFYRKMSATAKGGN